MILPVKCSHLFYPSRYREENIRVMPCFSWVCGNHESSLLPVTENVLKRKKEKKRYIHMVSFSPINSKASALNVKKHSLCKYITIKKKSHRQSWQATCLPKICGKCLGSFRSSRASDLFKWTSFSGCPSNISKTILTCHLWNLLWENIAHNLQHHSTIHGSFMWLLWMIIVSHSEYFLCLWGSSLAMSFNYSSAFSSAEPIPGPGLGVGIISPCVKCL